MLLLSWLVSLIIAFGLGYFAWDLRISIKTLAGELRSHFHDQPEPEATGTVVEPIDDPIAAAKAEFEATQARLNNPQGVGSKYGPWR